VLAAEHLLRLTSLDFGGELVEAAHEVRPDVFAPLRPFHQHGEIVDAALERVAQRAVSLERLPALQDLLGCGLVFPEIRIGGLLLYFREFFCGPGCVKDSSADRTRAWSGPDTGGAGRQTESWTLGFGR